MPNGLKGGAAAEDGVRGKAPNDGAGDDDRLGGGWNGDAPNDGAADAAPPLPNDGKVDTPPNGDDAAVVVGTAAPNDGKGEAVAGAAAEAPNGVPPKLKGWLVDGAAATADVAGVEGKDAAEGREKTALAALAAVATAAAAVAAVDEAPKVNGVVPELEDEGVTPKPPKAGKDGAVDAAKAGVDEV